METKTRQELANDYGIDRRTLYRWFKEAQIVLSGRGIIKPKELQVIYKILGKPKKN